MPAVTKSRPRPSVLRGPQPRSRPVSRRLDYKAAAPEGIRGLYAPHSYVTASVPRPLLDLVWLRVSQINGCAYCIDLHSREAAEHGAPQRTIHTVPGWLESPLFADLTRAAFAYAEEVPRLTDPRVADAAPCAAAAHFPHRTTLRQAQ